jgi:hypothetical protein
MNPEERAAIDKHLADEGLELSKSDWALLDAMLEERQYGPGSPQQIAKRFEKDPQAYEGLLYLGTAQTAWYQSEVERLAKISKITQPVDHTGRKIAAEAATRLAKKLQAEDPSLSDLDALSRAYEQAPELYVR